VKLHVIIDPNAVKIRIIARTLTASATSLGIRDCRRRWTGHISAMMKTANANGAKTERAK